MTIKDNQFVEKYLTPLAVLLGAIIIAFAVAFGTGGHPSLTGSQGGTGGAQAVDIQNLTPGDSPVIGDPNAPVTMALWFDYQCPFCKQYETTTLQQVYANYIATGKVKLVLMDFQFLGNDSTTAALFARALYESYPDKFYAWFEAMFKAQDEEGDQGFGDLPSIETLTKTIPGVDVSRVEALMNQNKAKYQAAIDADRQEGATFGVNGTPGTLIGTQVFSGAVGYDQISAALDAELKK